MSQVNFYILTGPVHTGKTTMLYNWCCQRSDVYGILTPLADGSRQFYDIATRRTLPMETAEGEECWSIGKYRFSIKNFMLASGIIEEALNKNGWLVIDEIGPLELMNKGFNEVMQKVVLISNDELKKLLVVRSSIVEEVVTHYKIEKNRIKIISDVKELEQM